MGLRAAVIVGKKEEGRGTYMLILLAWTPVPKMSRQEGGLYAIVQRHQKTDNKRPFPKVP
jgi:hypothetical protein